MKPNNPLVSIIIPTYNRAHLISETLDSVLAQTYTNWECIVVDDGSTDHTKEVVQAYVKKDGRFRFYHRPPEHQPGGNGARNYGFKMCNGEYVNWFDDDDLMHESFLNLKMDGFFSNLHLDIVICDCKAFIKSENKILFKNSYNLLRESNLIEDYICRKINIQTASILWRKSEIFNLIYDEELTQSQDYDFICKYFKRKYLVQFNYHIINKELLFIRKGNDSISTDYKNSKFNHVKSFLIVKSRIIKNFINNKTIVKSTLNNILSSLNSSLQKKNNNEIISLHFYTIDSLIFNELKKYKAQWFLLKNLSKIILILQRGAYLTRKLYKI